MGRDRIKISFHQITNIFDHKIQKLTFFNGSFGYAMACCGDVVAHWGDVVAHLDM